MLFRSNFLLKSFLGHWPLFFYGILFMAALNAASHGTQDIYPTFLQKQHGFVPATTSLLVILGAVGAIGGAIGAGFVSQRIGRRTAVVIGAVIAACTIPLWALSHTIPALAIGVFIMQFGVQGCWGVIPAHLNELSPPEVRGTFPGFTYQLGNLVAAGIPQIEAIVAQRMPLPNGDPNYAGALAVVAAIVMASVFILALLGHLVRRENRAVAFTA